MRRVAGLEAEALVKAGHHVEDRFGDRWLHDEAGFYPAGYTFREDTLDPVESLWVLTETDITERTALVAAFIAARQPGEEVEADDA